MIGLKIRFAKPIFDKGTKEALASVLDQRAITNSGKVAAFENAFLEYTGGGSAVAVSSCMSALHLSLIDLGVGHGDEVIVPSLTHAATAHAVTLTGAKVVPSEVDRAGNLDPTKIEVNANTAAIICVHYLGNLCQMAALTSFERTRKYDILPSYVPVIEDCALSLGSFSPNHDSPRHAGLLSRNGCFSFYPCKHITTGEGGMILTSHRDLAERMRKRRSFGIDPKHGTVVMQGTNARMTEFQAAIGLEQLKKAPEWLERRRENQYCLERKLDGLEITSGSYGISVFVNQRDRIVRSLAKKNVEVSTYYRYSISQHPFYKTDTCPISDEMAFSVVTLSVGPHLKPKHMCYQAEMLKDLL